VTLTIPSEGFFLFRLRHFNGGADFVWIEFRVFPLNVRPAFYEIKIADDMRKIEKELQTRPDVGCVLSNIE
jgi:hypothetical protein